MKLSDIIVSDAITSSLKATTRDDAIGELVGALAAAGAIPESSVREVTEAVLAREAQVTTGIGKGVAVPHAKVKGIKKPVGTIGCAAEGIDFDSLDGRPVHSVILLLSSPENADEHLQAMEAVFRQVQRETFRQEIRHSHTQEEIADLVRGVDDLG